MRPPQLGHCLSTHACLAHEQDVRTVSWLRTNQGTATILSRSVKGGMGHHFDDGRSGARKPSESLLVPLALCFPVKCHRDGKANLSGQGLGCQFVGLQGVQYSSPSGCAFWVTQAIMAGRWSADIKELGSLCI